MPVGIGNSNTQVRKGKKIIKKISKPKTKPKKRGGKGGTIFHNLTDVITDNEGKIEYLNNLKIDLDKDYIKIYNCYENIIKSELYKNKTEEINDKFYSTIKIKYFLNNLIDFLLYLIAYGRGGTFRAFYNDNNVPKIWNDIKKLFKNNINKNNNEENTQIIILLNAIVGGINKEKYFEENITTIEAIEKYLGKFIYIHHYYNVEKGKVIEKKYNTIEELLEFFEWLLFEKYPTNDMRIIIIISIIDNIYSVFLRNLTDFKDKLKTLNKLKEVTELTTNTGDKTIPVRERMTLLRLRPLPARETVEESNVTNIGGAKKKKGSKVVAKRAPTPYNKFVKKHFPELKKKFPNDKAPEIMKKIAIEWKKTKK
jgi:mannitol/fructose-specific phosphotransferase system IIA component